MDEKQENKQEILDSLSKQAVEFSTKIESVKGDFARIEKIIEEIDLYNGIFLRLKKELDNPEIGLSANLENSAKTKKDIDSIKTSSDEQLTTIKTALASVQENIRLMNEEYNNFELIKEKINNPESGFLNLFSVIEKTKKDIDSIKTSSDEQLTTIKTALASVQENIRLMNEEYNNFELIKEKINNPESGFLKFYSDSEKTVQDISAIKTQSDTIFAQISKLRDESNKYTEEIVVLKSSSEKNTAAIEEYEKQGKIFKEKIEKIYKIATDSTLANSFDERKESLKKSTGKWLYALVTATIILAAIVILIFVFKKTDNVDAYTWYRLTMTSPLIFFISFATIQYSKERLLLEKYAFKSVTALSLEGYTTLLINTFGKGKNTDDNEKEILKFVLNSMSTIYQEPHETPKDSKLSLEIDGKFASFKGDFAKSIEETKEKLINTIKDEVKNKVLN